MASTHRDRGLMVQSPSSVGANHDLQKSIMSGGLIKAKASVSHTKSFSLKSVSLLFYVYGTHITTAIPKQD